ncbi:MAG: Gfo/Idh/MocA family oxidoreductase [Anaerolineae bacterium]|nr:Gfo/Idh/MocA family oxidoreductase [Anaerolineae bacterium]
MPSPLRALLVGCGGISRAWLDAIKAMPDVDMVAFVDLIEAAARSRATEYGYTNAYTGVDLAVALDAAKPDVVFNCTVPEAHAETTITALERGCHVLCEKPLADSMDNARQMIAAAHKAGRIFAVIQNRRYDPNIRRLRKFLDSGVLGRITTVNCDFYIGAHFGGFRDHMPHVLLLDMAIHTFDAARLITGGDPRTVYCHEWNPPGSWYDHDASAVTIFEMSDRVIYTYRGSWCSEGLNTTWECDWRIVGEQGSVTWDGAQGFKAEVIVEGGAFRSKMQPIDLPEWDYPDMPRGHAGVIAEFVRAVQTGGSPETVCTDNVKSLAMVFGAIESAEQGQKIKIE